MSDVHVKPTRKNFKDLTGMQLGVITVLSFSRLGKCGHSKWNVHCSRCGRTFEAFYTNLRRDKVGCVCAKTKHGMSGSLEYHAYYNLIQRCTNPKVHLWERYGGRGISVCQRWIDSFENFYADMGPKPTPKHSIDRIDGNGNYCPENCRWATPKEQALNLPHTKMLTVDGKTMCISDWSRETGIPGGTISSRLSFGWSPERALSQKRRPKRRKVTIQMEPQK